MRNSNDQKFPASALSRPVSTNRSWLPMQPHLLVAVDPLCWSQRARADQRWQREATSSSLASRLTSV